MKSFRCFLFEAGQPAGKLEIVRTSVDDAYAWARKAFAKHNKDIDSEIPKFKEHYILAQKRATLGHTKRKDMPVIDAGDVRKFQRRLQSGVIDIRKPFGDWTDTKNPFPDGLVGKSASNFMEAGLAKHDGSDKDDKVNIQQNKIAVVKLKPIQKQIYVDNAIMNSIRFGVKNSKKFLTDESFFILSADHYIIDGHHRYLSAMLIDPKIKINALLVDLPIKELLPLSLAYGDAIGNKRNA